MQRRNIDGTIRQQGKHNFPNPSCLTYCQQTLPEKFRARPGYLKNIGYITCCRNSLPEKVALSRTWIPKHNRLHNILQSRARAHCHRQVLNQVLGLELVLRSAEVGMVVALLQRDLNCLWSFCSHDCRAYQFFVALHDDPDPGSNALVNERERQVRWPC